MFTATSTSTYLLRKADAITGIGAVLLFCYSYFYYDPNRTERIQNLLFWVAGWVLSTVFFAIIAYRQKSGAIGSLFAFLGLLSACCVVVFLYLYFLA